MARSKRNHPPRASPALLKNRIALAVAAIKASTIHAEFHGIADDFIQ
jgi:hypothetical protein